MRLIDFAPVRSGRLQLMDLARGMGPAELAEASRAVHERLLELLDAAIDADVTFEPDDPTADDTFAADPGEATLPWTLGHVIAHVTASAEEAAFLAAELARGIEPHGRSRSEVAWPSLRTLADVRQRLAESQRMIQGTLDAWPDKPHLEVVYTASNSSIRNAPARFLGGLMHEDEHLAQVAEIERQARVSRG
jgi:DinB superfamily